MEATKGDISVKKLSSYQKKKIFLETFQKSFSITKSCESAGVSRWTYYRWLEKDEKFKQKMQEIEEMRLDFAETILNEEMFKKKNLRAILWFLERKGKNRGYAPKLETEHSGEVNNIIKVEIVDTEGEKKTMKVKDCKVIKEEGEEEDEWEIEYD